MARKRKKQTSDSTHGPFPKINCRVDAVIRGLGFGDWHDGNRADYSLFAWPPDVFAMAATILRESGAYLQASRPLNDSVSTESKDAWKQEAWRARVLAAACAWRRMPPPILVDLGDILLDRLDSESRPSTHSSSSSTSASEEIEAVRVSAEKTKQQFQSWRAGTSMPERIIELLDEVFARRDTPLYQLSRPADSDIGWMIFLELMCIADEASRGVGLVFEPQESIRKKRTGRKNDPWEGYPSDSFVILASAVLLQEQAYARMQKESRARRSKSTNPSESVDFQPTTLCWRVDPSRAVVLPKMRTSQRGVTIRSFSLHLSLLNGSDVEVIWNPPSRVLLKSPIRKLHASDSPSSATAGSPSDVVRHAGPYNVVLLPWPHSIRPAQFSPALRDGAGSEDLDQMFACLGARPTANDRFFQFEHDTYPENFRWKINELVADAERQVGPVHGLVLPEMAMTRRQFDEVFADRLPEQLDFLACGVYEPSSEPGVLGRNYVILRQRKADGESGYVELTQQKHHRWALDSNQLAQYSLGSSLRGKATWWEAIDLPRRSLHFVALDAFVAFTVLVCEDLARPDPVADAVRAVGPNLVICLLLDGPQLKERWSARYATVLADDPGSSVLTLSSLGMVNLSRVRDKLHEKSRIIALWRESGGVPVELHLPERSDGLVISLTAEDMVERTLDGRPDAGTGTVIRLAGVHPISWRKS